MAIRLVNDTGNINLTGSNGNVELKAPSKKVDLTGYATEIYVNEAIAEKHSDINYLKDLIDTDMLPSIYDSIGRILTNSNNQIILRY